MAGWLDELGPLPEAEYGGSWHFRGWHNVPGPLFNVEGCHDDPPTANAAGRDGTTFVWRQPRTRAELEEAIGYLVGGWLFPNAIGADGDKHWTLDKIRVWWSYRAGHAAAYREAGIPDVGRYFEQELPAYLRAYAFFVEHGRRPAPTDALPDIDTPLEIPVALAPAELASSLQLLVEAPRFVTQRIRRTDRLPFWGERNRLDVPGPFSGGSAETRVPGVCAGRSPFVYRQPSSVRELDLLLAAACADPLAFGFTTERWTASDLRHWWVNNHEDLREALRAGGVANADDYVDRELPEYLRGYLFVIAHGHAPGPHDELPELVRAYAASPLVFRTPPQLPFTRGVIENEQAARSQFDERNPLNVPGMFYGANTDTCDTGPAEAPENVVLDENGQEIVFRQPRDVHELACVLNAVYVECFDGYGTDGNAHWTPALVRAWWADRDRIREAWRIVGVPDVDAMFEQELPRYLRGYLFFLEHGRVPNLADRLPEL